MREVLDLKDRDGGNVRRNGKNRVCRWCCWALENGEHDEPLSRKERCCHHLAGPLRWSALDYEMTIYPASLNKRNKVLSPLHITPPYVPERHFIHNRK